MHKHFYVLNHAASVDYKLYKTLFISQQDSFKELDLPGYQNKCSDKSPNEASAVLSDESATSRDNTPPGRRSRSFGGINCVGSGEVVPASGNNGASHEHNADDSEKTGANNDGNGHSSNNIENFQYPKCTDNKLMSLMTGNPDNEGCSHQKLATEYHCTQPNIINSVGDDGRENSQYENKVKIDKHTTRVTSVKGSSGRNGEIRGELNMEINGETGNLCEDSKGSNTDASLVKDAVNNSQKLLTDSPGKSKTAEGFHPGDSPRLEYIAEKAEVTQGSSSEAQVTSNKHPDNGIHPEVSSGGNEGVHDRDNGHQPEADLTEEEKSIMR